MSPTTLPRLLAISDRRRLPDGGLDAWLDALAAAGVGAVQLREKDLGAEELLELAIAARRRLGEEVRLLINARVDVALAAAADGVHLPVRSVPPAALRQRFGEGLLIGCSTHTLEEVEAAARSGADYVTFGPVYPTPSKMRYGPPPGPAGLRRAVAVGPPVYALGGVTIERLPEVAAAGARGAAGIGVFHDTERLAELTATAERLFS